jgi:hypothetical protein
MLNSELDETWNVVDAKLLHEPASVGFNTLGGKMEDIGDFLARLAFNDQLQDLSFS